MVKTAKKKKASSQKVYVSPKQLQRVKEEATHEAIYKTATLYMLALAEKGWNEDEIAEVFETVSRYARYVDEHLVKVREIQEMIEKKTGIILKGKW